MSAARTQLDAWRECGADRRDPTRFRLIEALERRSALYEGEARQVIDARIATLIEAYARDVAHAGSPADACAAEHAVPVRGPLAGLIDEMAGRAQPGYPELEALDHFRQIWSRVSAETQLRQSLLQVPGNAGPLNSSSLVHRSLSLMRELSPAYLQQFLSYVDALSWVEQMAGGSAVAGKDLPRAGAAKKSGRGKAR